MNADLFNETGYIVIEDFLSQEDTKTIKDICYNFKKEIIDNDLIGKSKNFGLSTYWRGLEMASTQSPILFQYYTSKKMYNMATQLLGTKDIYIFNDQIVVKLPKEDFQFDVHTDNQFGPNNQLALEGGFKTITCCLVLDDFTPENGPISILNKKTGDWDIPLPKKSSLIVWDGNTPHASNKNDSEQERSVWLCVYSTHDLTKMPTNPLTDEFLKFYGEKFII